VRSIHHLDSKRFAIQKTQCTRPKAARYLCQKSRRPTAASVSRDVSICTPITRARMAAQTGFAPPPPVFDAPPTSN
jgi:hypothetical protein